jgi:SHAQKYF class myb-like DNA-binding protein
MEHAKRRLSEDSGEDGVVLKRPAHESNRSVVPVPLTDQQSSEDQPQHWNEQLHRAFIQGVFETGLKNASPSVIMEQMTLSHSAITSERVKSHLQKYRNNKDKNKEQFLAEYDNFMQKALTVGAAGGANSMSYLSPDALLKLLGSDNMIGGDLPALLTYSVMHDDGQSVVKPLPIYGESDQSQSTSRQHLSIESVRNGSQEFTNYISEQEGTKIPFPVLSEDERNSPLGASIGHVKNYLPCRAWRQCSRRSSMTTSKAPHILSKTINILSCRLRLCYFKLNRQALHSLALQVHKLWHRAIQTAPAVDHRLNRLRHCVGRPMQATIIQSNRHVGPRTQKAELGID